MVAICPFSNHSGHLHASLSRAMVKAQLGNLMDRCPYEH